MALGWYLDDAGPEGRYAAGFSAEPDLRTVGLVLFAVLVALGATVPARAATDAGRPVQTETIVVPPDKAIEPDVGTPPDSAEP